MNREIKFRAWDPKKELMMYDDVTAEHDVDYWDGVQSSTVALINREISRGDFVWMQFTGLKDKNGKEIYEGDIVREKSKKDWHSEVDRMYVVEFGEQDFGDHSYHQSIGWNATSINQYGKPSGMDSGRLPGNGLLGLCWNHSGIDTEVIGNIYENHELLNEPQIPVLKSAEMLISNVPTFVDYTKKGEVIEIVSVVFGGATITNFKDIEEEILTKIKNQENE